MAKTLKVLAAVVVLYLAAGVLFAANAQPQQLWACPAPKEPHGEILHDKPVSPECRPTVTMQERVTQFAFATVLGIPFTVVKAFHGGE